MASREFEVLFRINGALSSEFAGAMRAAQSQLDGLSRQARVSALRQSREMQQLQGYLGNLQKKMADVGKFKQLQNQIAGTSNELVRARLRTAQLTQEYQNQRKQTDQMRQSLQRLKTVYRENKSSMSADQRATMQSQIRAAQQELKDQKEREKSALGNLTSHNTNTAGLQSRLRSQQAALRELQSSMSQAGVNVSQLASYESRLRAEIERTTQAIERQNQINLRRQEASDRHTNAQANLSHSFDNFQGAMSTAQTIMSPFTDAVKTSMDFNAAMSEVKAISGATGKEFDALRNQAKELGSTTKYTASEAAAGMKYLAVAGWDTNQILKGMPDMLALAQAGNVDLALTADIVSDGLTAFNMNLNETPDAANRFANAMIAAATGSNTSVELMGETFKYAGAVAGSLGYSIEDVALATGLMGNASIKGSMAGTALRSTFTRLVKPPKDAAAALEALGVSATNSDGTMKPFHLTLEQLRTAFKGLSDAQKTEYASSIAGQEAMAGFLAMINASDEDYAKLQNRIDTAQSKNLLGDIQGVMSDNLKAAFDSLNSAKEGLQIAIGDAFDKPMQSFVGSIAERVGELAQWVNEHQELARAAGIAAAAVAGLIVAAAGYSVAAAGVEYLSASYAALRVQAIGSAAAQRIAQFAAMSWSQVGAGISGAFTGLIGKIQAASSAVVSFFTTAAASNGASIVTSITNIGTAFLNAAKGAMAFVFSPVGVALMALAVAGYYVYTHWSQVAPVFENLASTLGGALQGAIQTISAAFQNLGVAVSNLSPAFSNLGGVIFGALAVVLNAVVNIAATIISTFGNAIATVISVFGSLGQAISAILAGDFSKAGEALKNALVSAVEGAIATIKSLLGGVFDTFANFFNPIEIMSKAPSGGGSFGTPESPPAPAVDTSQAQAQVNNLGSASDMAAAAVQANGQSAQLFNPTVQAVGTDITTLQTSIGAVNPELANALTQLSAVGTDMSMFQTGIGAVNPELTNAQTQLSANNMTLTENNSALAQTSAGLQSFNAALSSTNGGLQSLSSSSSSAASAVSSLGSAASSAVSAMQSAAASAASAASAAASAAAAKPAANAKGGIYNRGAFLTWFAEKSPEAAIPLDKSTRAISLWQRVGQMLGVLPKEISATFDSPGDDSVSARSPKYDELGNIIGLHGLKDNVITKNDDVQVARSKKIAQLDEWKRKNPAPKKSVPAKSSGGFFERVQSAMDFLPSLPDIGGFVKNILPENPVLRPKNQWVGENFEKLAEPVKQSKSFEVLQAARNRLQNTQSSGSIFGGGDNFGGGILSSLADEISPSTNTFDNSSPIDLKFEINIQGNANADDVQNGIVQSIPMLKNVFENEFAEYKHELQRKSFA